MRRSLALPLMLLALWACDDGPRATPEATPDGAADGAVDLAVDAFAPKDGQVADQAPPDAGPAPDARAAPDDGVDPCPHAVPGDALALGDAPFEGSLCPGNSMWFAVDLAAATELSVVLDFSHRAGDLELRLFAGGDLGQAVAESASASDQERVGQPAGEAQALLVEVYGYRGAGGAFTLTAHRLPAGGRMDARVQGQVTFDNLVFSPDGFTGERTVQPAEHLVVQVRRVFDDAAVAEALTDAEGRFEVVWPADAEQAYVVEARAQVKVPLQDGELLGQVADRDRPAAVYALRSAPFSPAAPPELSLHGAADEAIGGALHIAHTVGEGLAFIAPWVSGAARVTVSWQAGQPWPCGSCYGGDQISLGGQIEDPDEYDDAIILHELGHWFVDHFSDDDSPGGSHRDRQVEPTLAYGEGLAYFFAAMIRDAPGIVDNFLGSARYIDLEAVTQQGEALPELKGTTDGTARGALREEVVGGVLWDAYDGPSDAEPFDVVELGVDGHMAIFTQDFGGPPPPDVGARGIDLADWLEVAACRVDAASLQPLADDRDFPWTVEGSGCAEKQRVPAPFSLQARKGVVWLAAQGPLPPLTVWRDGRVARTGWRCAGRCALGPAAADAAWAVTAPGAPWAGASWLGAKAVARLAGGQRLNGRRLYRSAR